MNKEQRVKRYEYLAKKYKEFSEKAHAQAKSMADVIPFGQPILIGHHSEKRDRKYRERIHRRFEKAFEFDKKAQHYAERAIASANNDCISSDDSDAVERLKEKLASLEKSQSVMKEINSIIRSKIEKETKLDAMQNLMPNTKRETLAKLFEPDFCGRIGFADFELTNNNANIRRIKLRIAQLEKSKGQEAKEYTVKGVKIVHNVDDNRLQLFFDGKPEEWTRDNLKRYGFRWSPYNGCWQRMLNNQGIYAGQQVINTLPKKEMVA